MSTNEMFDEEIFDAIGEDLDSIAQVHGYLTAISEILNDEAKQRILANINKESNANSAVKEEA